MRTKINFYKICHIPDLWSKFQTKSLRFIRFINILRFFCFFCLKKNFTLFLNLFNTISDKIEKDGFVQGTEIQRFKHNSYKNFHILKIIPFQNYQDLRIWDGAEKCKIFVPLDTRFIFFSFFFFNNTFLYSRIKTLTTILKITVK